jgi:hypothetical protein
MRPAFKPRTAHILIWPTLALLAACQVFAAPTPTAAPTTPPTATPTNPPTATAAEPTPTAAATAAATPDQSALIDRWKPAIGGAGFNRQFCQIMLGEARRHVNGEINSLTLFGEQVLASQAVKKIVAGYDAWKPDSDLVGVKQQIVANSKALQTLLNQWRGKLSSAELITQLVDECPSLAGFEQSLIQQAFSEGLAKGSYDQLTQELLAELRALGIPVP